MSTEITQEGDYTYLCGEELGRVEVTVEVGRNKGIQLCDHSIAFHLVVAIALGMPGTKYTKILGVGLTKVGWTNPYLVEDTE